MRLNAATTKRAKTIGQCVVAGAVVYCILTLALFGRVFIIKTPQLQGSLPGQVQVTLTDVHETTSSSSPRATGYVANTGSATIYGMNAMIEAFGQDGQILAVCHVTPARLRPKQSVKFDLPLSGSDMSSLRLVSFTHI